MWISSTFAVTALVAGSLSVGPAAAAEGALTLCFSKSPTGPGSWAGQYAVAEPGKVCDPTGGAPLTSMLTATPEVRGEVAMIQIRWEFREADGDLLLRTDQTGTLSLRDGLVVLNGEVTAGPLTGARTHDTGRPTDAAGSYAGTMRVAP